MTFINVYVKKGKVKHHYLHWRQAIGLFMKDFEGDGKDKEFIFVDLDDMRIISSQSCFSLMDLPEWTAKKIARQFEYEEV